MLLKSKFGNQVRGEAVTVFVDGRTEVERRACCPQIPVTEPGSDLSAVQMEQLKSAIDEILVADVEESNEGGGALGGTYGILNVFDADGNPVLAKSVSITREGKVVKKTLAVESLEFLESLVKELSRKEQ